MRPLGTYGSGLKTGTTAHARLAVHNATNIAKKVGKSLDQIFVDMTGAFAGMVRAAIFRGVRAEEIFCMIRDLEFSSDEARRIVEEYSGVEEFEDEPEQHALWLISDLHEGRWSAFEYAKGVLLTGNGTLAGTSAADVVVTLLAMDINAQC